MSASDLTTIHAEFPNAQTVFVMGEFNNWSTAATPMQPKGCGQWEVKLSASQLMSLCFFVWQQGESFGRVVRTPPAAAAR